MPETKQSYTTITVRAETKARLARIKGPRQSWDDFFVDIVDGFPNEEELRILEERLDEMRSGKVDYVRWEAIKKKYL